MATATPVISVLRAGIAQQSCNQNSSLGWRVIHLHVSVLPGTWVARMQGLGQAGQTRSKCANIQLLGLAMCPTVKSRERMMASKSKRVAHIAHHEVAGDAGCRQPQCQPGLMRSGDQPVDQCSSRITSPKHTQALQAAAVEAHSKWLRNTHPVGQLGEGLPSQHWGAAERAHALQVLAEAKIQRALHTPDVKSLHGRCTCSVFVCRPAMGERQHSRVHRHQGAPSHTVSTGRGWAYSTVGELSVTCSAPKTAMQVLWG